MTSGYDGTFTKPLVDDLLRLSKQLQRGPVDPALVGQVVNALGGQPPASSSRASAAINHYLGFHGQPLTVSFPIWWRRWFSPAPAPLSVTELVDAAPGIEYLYLLHPSGWLREAALRRVRSPVSSPFWILVLAQRLNDWVPQVRDAAAAAFDRAVQPAPVGAVAEALIHLSGRTRNWQRWTDGSETLSALQRRTDVAEAIVRTIVSSPTGPMRRVLRELLRSDAIDAHLLTIAREAVQPSVRALAFEVLLRGSATWPLGLRKRWIDKPMGLFRHELSFGARPIERPGPFEGLLELAADDRSSLVRKVAASGLIEQEQLSADPARLARRFAADPNAGVQERGKFLLNRHQKN